MKKSIKIIVTLLFILSISLNVWQVMMKRPLSPNAGNRINFEIKAKDINKSTFRIATYNIRSGKGLDGIRNIKRTASILNGFDIIALNEVKGETLLSHSSQAEKLGEMLDMGWLFLPNQERYYKEYYGNGLLSSFDVTYWYREQLIYDTKRCNNHRNLTTIQFNFNNKLVTLLLTHLDLRAIRGAQLSYVINKFKKHNHCILIGDLNSSRRDLQLIDLLGEKNTIDAINVALGSNDTLGRVDWIIVKGFNVIDGGYVPKGISDHRLYWVELEINQRYDPLNFPPGAQPQATTSKEPYNGPQAIIKPSNL